MCGQHIDRKCEKCGWGLPLLERRRLKVELKDFSPNAAVGIGNHDHAHDHDHHNGHPHGHEVSQLMTRTEALGEMDKGKATAHKTCDPIAVVHSPAGGPSSSSTSTSAQGIKRAADQAATEAISKKLRTAGSFSDSDDDKKLVRATKPGPGALTREIRLTRPWKTVYCERLLVERNWRKGRCTTKTLKVRLHPLHLPEAHC
jgi:F-box/WD-40 domain protein MET30